MNIFKQLSIIIIGDDMENKKFIVAIVILSILLLAALGFIGYDKFLKKNDETIKTVINDAEMDLNVFYKVRDTLNNLDNAFNDTSNKYFGYIYGNKNVMIEKLDPKVALYAAIYGDIKRTNAPQLITGAKVKSNLQNMFGKYVEYKASNIEWDQNSYIPYDKDNDFYTHQLPVVNDLKLPRYFASEVSTVIKEEEIVVKRKSYYVEYETDEAGTKRIKASIYTDKDKKKIVATMNLKNGAINDKEVMARYSSKLNTYLYTFKENSNKDYVLYSIEKVRK